MIAYVNTSPARTTAGRDYRVRIEALLDKASSDALDHLWQEVFPYHVDELPQRHAIIEDLADFAEVLQPQLADMRADQLCGLIEKYVATRKRQQSFAKSLIRGVGYHGAIKGMPQSLSVGG
jgi:hypothetical protein